MNHTETIPRDGFIFNANRDILSIFPAANGNDAPRIILSGRTIEFR